MMVKQTQSNADAKEPQTARHLAEDISGIAGNMTPIVKLLFEQSQEIDDADVRDKMFALTDCANRYLREIRTLCDAALKGGAQ